MKATIDIEGKTYKEFPNFLQNSNGFNIQFTLKFNNNEVFDLNRYTVTFKAREYNAEENQIEAECTIINATSGICIYTVNENDFDTIGRFETELECVSDNIILTTKLSDLIVEDDIYGS